MKNHISQATLFIALIAALVFVLASPSAAPAAPVESASWSEVDASGKSCDFWSCPFGCCDEQDQCHTEWSDDYCGYYGEDCEACEYPTPYCVFEIGYAQCEPCNAWTCPFGCCDAEGVCHSEGSSDYCGYYGEDCVACTVPTPYCFNEGVYAQCTACNALTCPLGCCGEDGLCHEENNWEYCGLAGVSCNTCTSPEPNCVVGLCAGCDAILCAFGCCDEDNVCHEENTPEYCGITGADCATCGGDTPNCYNGWCVGCNNDFPCPDGCCELRTSLCCPGDNNEECGATGTLCSNCEVQHLFCNEGACDSCNSTSCGDGCCDSNGGCRTGTENNFCGRLGTACANCVLSGQICIDHACDYGDDDDDDDSVGDDDNDDTVIETCGPDNCLAGCCSNGQCWPGDEDDKCGSHAAACEDCQAADLVCQDRECATPSDDDTLVDDDDDSVGDDDNDDNDDNDTGGEDSSGDDDDDSGSCGC